jgi:cytochrome oxidase Cu insertion factor (SCO1/SenC/PrrC family)
MKRAATRFFRSWQSLILLVLVALSFALGTTAAYSAVAGQLAFDFHGTRVDGKEVSLSSYAGKPLVLIFWTAQ